MDRRNDAFSTDELVEGFLSTHLNVGVEGMTCDYTPTRNEETTKNVAHACVGFVEGPRRLDGVSRGRHRHHGPEGVRHLPFPVSLECDSEVKGRNLFMGHLLGLGARCRFRERWFARFKAFMQH